MSFILAVIAMMFLYWTSPLAAGPLNTALIPAEAQWVVHIDMNLFNKTLLNQLMEQKNDSFLKGHDKNDFFKETNINWQQDISAITLFGMHKGEKEMVVFCTGTFDVPHLLAFINKKQVLKKEKYNRQEIHQAGPGNFFAFPTKNLLLYSKDSHSIKKVLDVLERKQKDISSATLMTYIKMIPADAFVLAAANDVSSMGGPGSDAGAILTNTGMATFMAMEKNSDLQLHVVLNTLNTQTAQNIEQVIRGLIAVVSMQKQEGKEEAFKLFNAIKITNEGKTLRLSLTYPSAKIVELLAEKHHRPMPHTHK